MLSAHSKSSRNDFRNALQTLDNYNGSKSALTERGV